MVRLYHFVRELSPLIWIIAYISHAYNYSVMIKRIFTSKKKHRENETTIF